MATVGHLAAGFALSRIAGRSPAWFDVAAITLAAAAPDIDFLSGLEHRGITHSLGSAMAVGAGVALVYRLLGRSAAGRVGILCALAVLSHVALDLLTDPSPVPALWPFSNVEYRLETHPLPSASPDASLLTAEGALRALGELVWSTALVVAGSFAARLHGR